MKTVLFTIVLLLSGAAMATERNSGPKGGLLGDMKPTQDMLTGQDPLETWKRSSEAGQYWTELMAKVKSRDLQLNQALKLQKERFPNDLGPIRSDGPPSAAETLYGR